jgi:hypothetical protein
MSTYSFTLLPSRDITFQTDKNGVEMACVQLEERIVVNEGPKDETSTVGRFFAHSKWSTPDYKLLRELADEDSDCFYQNIPMQLELVQKNSYWNLVKGSLKQCNP